MKLRSVELGEARDMEGKSKVIRKGLAIGMVLIMLAVAFAGITMNATADHAVYDPYRIYLDPETNLPVADAGTDQSVVEGTEVTLDGTGSSGGTIAPGDLDPELVALWHLDEGSGATAHDETDNDNDGTVSGAVWTSGIIDDGLSFDGVNDKVDAGDIDALDGLTELSISFWVKPDSLNQLRSFVSKYSRTYGNWIIETSFPGKGGANDIIFAPTDVAGHDWAHTSEDVLTVGEWTHVVMVYDGSGTGNTDKLKGYIDGESKTLTFNDDIPSSLPSTPDPVMIGANIDGGRYFDGIIDEVAIWDRALTGGEVQGLYHMVVPEPVAHWHLDETSSSTAYDATPNNHDGSIYGSARVSGVSNGAFNFDGNDVVRVPNDAHLNFGTGQDFSLEVWIKTKPDQSSWQGTILSKMSAYNVPPHKRSFGYSLMVRGVSDTTNEGKVGLWIGDGDASDGFFQMYSTGEYDDNKWHHVVATISRNCVARLYIDGVQESVAAVSYMSSLNIATTGYFEIGRETVFNSYGFRGKIDEVSVYDRALSIAEVQNHYNNILPGPIAYWPMDEGSGTTVYDSTTNHNDGTSTGPTWTTSGKFDDALSFDGVNDYVSVPFNDLSNDPMTIAWWMNTNDMSAVLFMDKLNWYDSKGIEIWLYDNSGGYGFLNVRGSSGTNVASSADYHGEWVHVGVVFDGTTAKIYRNGVFDTSGSIGQVITSTKDFIIGMYPGLAGWYLNGVIDEVSIWDRSLSAQEVSDYYNSGNELFHEESRNLEIVKYEWDFDNDAVFDYSESLNNAPDGTFDGTTTETFVVAGTYPVTLKITNELCKTDTDTSVITVYNSAPVADAGPDQTLEQTSHAGALVTLDGSGSSDPNNDPLTYTWTWNGGSATGVSPTETFTLGATIVTLTVSDGSQTDTDTVVITVVDTTPPEITVEDDPIVLWPPNHKYHSIETDDFVLAVSDICDAEVGTDDVVIKSVSSDEPEDIKGGGDGNTKDDIMIVDPQTVKLRAERQGSGNGRVYTINIAVTDGSDNTATRSFQVWVPHNKKAAAIDDCASAGYTVYP